jgi:ATP-dependent Clp protease ATP-binding subunit ClpB
VRFYQGGGYPPGGGFPPGGFPHRPGGQQPQQPQGPQKGETLKQYTVDLTELAEQGKLDPVIGRDDEVRRTIGILSRRSKSNPVIL